MYKIIAGLILWILLKLANHFESISQDTYLIVFSLVFVLVSFGLDERNKR